MKDLEGLLKSVEEGFPRKPNGEKYLQSEIKILENDQRDKRRLEIELAGFEGIQEELSDLKIHLSKIV